MNFLALSGITGLLAGISLLHWFSKGKSPHMKSLENKHVVITGGSSGIGLAMAEEVLLQGGFVTIISRSSANLQGAVERLVQNVSCHPDRIFSQAADVSNSQAIAQAIHEAFRWKPIDVLICNAGLTRGGSLENQTVEDIDLTIGTNLNGTIYPVHAALSLLKHRSKEHPVSIVFFASLASMFIFYGHSVYTATKYAVKGLAEALKFELMPYNIAVSLVCPGFVATPLLNEVEKDDDNIEVLKVVNLYDHKTAENPRDVAKRVLEGAKKGSYLIAKTNYPGLFLSTVARGFVPAESLGRFWLEMILYFPFRAITVLAQNDYRKAILEHFKRKNK
ncbi:hypothetical protein KI387_010229 [Taxus chinensis]|uniref:Ketoreductase domain-containing protein n=1 Tax=Taxus chinensis TaxID=29808 RepID=A0AA38KUF1_TAXCH|nr:hypothetical protein KI387_010229 [Taxus chinensis]